MIAVDNVKARKHLRVFCSRVANIMIVMYPFHNFICFILDVLEIKIRIAYKGSKSIDINPILNTETVFFVMFLPERNKNVSKYRNVCWDCECRNICDASVGQ